MDFVVVKTADGKTFRRNLDLPRIVVGRSSRSDLVVPDLSLSRVHAEILREGDRFLIKDAGSKNGTFLNDRPVSVPTALRKGDKIGLGTAALWFNSDPQSQIEITENPTPAAGTTAVPVEQLLTDSKRARDTDAIVMNMQLTAWRDGTAANDAFVRGSADALRTWRQP